MIIPFSSDRILLRGSYLGYQWIVAHNGIGSRTGFVRLPPKHPWHSLTWHEINNVTVHNGLSASFSETAERPSDLDQQGWWIGFHCGGFEDERDHSLPMDVTRRRLVQMSSQSFIYPFARGRSRIRSTAFVKGHCISLCEQAAAAALAAARGKRHRRGVGPDFSIGRHWITPWRSQNLVHGVRGR